MPIIASSNGDKTFTPCPPGSYQAVCVDVVDLGLLEVTYAGQTKQQHKVAIVWIVDEVNEENGKPFLIQKRYTLSLNEKANMRADLQAWRGKPFTPDELKGFDVEHLIGANALIGVVHNTKPDGRVFANVSSLMPIRRGMTRMPVPSDYIRRKDREPQPAPQPTTMPGNDEVFTADEYGDPVPF